MEHASRLNLNLPLSSPWNQYQRLIWIDLKQWVHKNTTWKPLTSECVVCVAMQKWCFTHALQVFSNYFETKTLKSRTKRPFDRKNLPNRPTPRIWSDNHSRTFRCMLRYWNSQKLVGHERNVSWTNGATDFWVFEPKRPFIQRGRMFWLERVFVVRGQRRNFAKSKKLHKNGPGRSVLMSWGLIVSVRTSNVSPPLLFACRLWQLWHTHTSLCVATAWNSRKRLVAICCCAFWWARSTKTAPDKWHNGAECRIRHVDPPTVLTLSLQPSICVGFSVPFAIFTFTWLHVEYEKFWPALTGNFSTPEAAQLQNPYSEFLPAFCLLTRFLTNQNKWSEQ